MIIAKALHSTKSNTGRGTASFISSRKSFMPRNRKRTAAIAR